MKKIFIIVFIFFFLFLITFFYFVFLKKKETIKVITNPSDKISSNNLSSKSNIIENVNYSSKDANGNEYIIDALQGEIEYSNPNIIYLTNVVALIKLSNSNDITITSNFGKYNSNNFDTIFSKNVIITYLDNNITGEYLDFSINRNSMIISRKVVYTNLENILTADVVEIDIETKDTKIFMYKNKEKVNIKTK